MKKWKITNKKRFSMFLILLSTIILLTVFVQFKDNRVYSSNYKPQFVEVVVKQGDTVWDIAIDNMPDKYDVREMVYEIEELNYIKNEQIHPGDKIKIPIHY